MRREIKFRCFYRGKMYPVKELYGMDSMSVNAIEMHIDGLGVRTVSPDSEHVEAIMQHTGLKDKNGVEIYEGDLIAEINKISELKKWGQPLVIEYGEYEGEKDSWGIKSCTTGFFCRYGDGQKTGLHNTVGAYGFKASDIIIVGNIYHNANLLKAEL